MATASCFRSTASFGAKAKPAGPYALLCCCAGTLLYIAQNGANTHAHARRSVLEITGDFLQNIKCFLNSTHTTTRWVSALALVQSSPLPCRSLLAGPNPQDVLNGVVKDFKGIKDGKMPTQMTIIAMTGATLLLMVVVAVRTPSQPRPKKD